MNLLKIGNRTLQLNFYPFAASNSHWEFGFKRRYTKFNPYNKETLTYGETLGPMVNITSVEDAKQYLQSYIEFLEKGIINSDATVKNNRTATEIAKINISYYAGNCDTKTQKRMAKLFLKQL